MFKNARRAANKNDDRTGVTYENEQKEGRRVWIGDDPYQGWCG